VAGRLARPPAYAHAVASFYDQFNLEPVGEHMVEVCTNVSCALYGAQAVLDAFEDELGCRAGETTANGKATLRTIECLGGCSWGTIVAARRRPPPKGEPRGLARVGAGRAGGAGGPPPGWAAPAPPHTRSTPPNGAAAGPP